MKVILTSRAAYPFHPYGGTEKYIYFLAKALTQEGVTVEIVASLPEGRQKKKTYEGITYSFVPPYINWASFFALLPSLRHLLFTINVARYLKGKDFDILHAYGTAPYAYLHLRNRVPVVYQPFARVHEVFDTRAALKVLGYKSWSPKGVSLHLGRCLDRYSITHADAVASEGDFQSETLAQLLGNNSNRIFNLPVGVDIQSVDKASKLGRLSRQDLGLTDNDLVLISVNKLDANRGTGYLVEALKLVKREVTNIKLILVGTGPEEERIKNQIEANNLTDSILHLKNVPEDLLYQYYALADIYVSPTLVRNSIQGVIEAMGCGKPVVSTGQDFWVKSGVNGYVAPKRDPEAMAKAVIHIYEAGKCKEFGNMSRKIAQDYDYRVIARAAIRKYEELLAK